MNDSVAFWIRTPCGRAKYQELAARPGLLARLPRWPGRLLLLQLWALPLWLLVHTVQLLLLRHPGTMVGTVFPGGHS